MNWDAVGAVAEALGAIAIFVTLAYLSFQIRETRRATATQAVDHLVSAYKATIAALGETQEVADVMSRGFEDYLALSQPERRSSMSAWKPSTWNTSEPSNSSAEASRWVTSCRICNPRPGLHIDKRRCAVVGGDGWCVPERRAHVRPAGRAGRRFCGRVGPIVLRALAKSAPRSMMAARVKRVSI